MKTRAVAEPSSCPSMKACGIKAVFHSVRFIDLFLLCSTIAVVFEYGSSWMGVTAGQLTTFRVALAAVCLIIVAVDAVGRKLNSLGVAVLGYSFLIIFQGVLSTNPGGAALQGIATLLMFLVPARFARRYGIEMLMEVLYWIFLIIVILMNGFALATGGIGFLGGGGGNTGLSNYIFGNKFVFSYVNMFFLSVVMYRYHSLAALLGVGIFFVYSCGIVQCSTGIVGILIMIVCYLNYRFFKPVLLNRWSIAIIVVAMAVVAVTMPGLMTLPAVQSFIVDVLGESANLTGRLEIYPFLFGLWAKNPILGYGSNGATNQVLKAVASAPNAQVGFFQILLSIGLVGGVLFCMVCVCSMRDVGRLVDRGRGLHVYLVAMAFCSLVEINLGLLFMLGLSLTRLVSIREQPAILDRQGRP